MQIARAPTTVSRPSCCRCGRSEEITCSTIAMATQISDRDRRADPDLAERVPAGLLAQEGRDDPDDQGRFEALPQSDYERGQHQ